MQEPLKFVSQFIQDYDTTKGGEILRTDNGDFKLEFHCAADMKAIREMYNTGQPGCMKNSPNGDEWCVYCHATSTDKSAREPVRPRTDAETQGNLLGLPLSRIHLCTLHAKMRMVEQCVFQDHQFAWNYQDLGNTEFHRQPKNNTDKFTDGQNLRVQSLEKVVCEELQMKVTAPEFVQYILHRCLPKTTYVVAYLLRDTVKVSFFLVCALMCEVNIYHKI